MEESVRPGRRAPYRGPMDAQLGWGTIGEIVARIREASAPTIRRNAASIHEQAGRLWTHTAVQPASAVPTGVSRKVRRAEKSACGVACTENVAN